MGPFLLLGLAATSFALIDVFGLFDGTSTPDTPDDAEALLDEDTALTIENNLLNDPSLQTGTEALDLDPYADEYAEDYYDFSATDEDDLIVLPEVDATGIDGWAQGSVIFGEGGNDTMVGNEGGDVLFGDEGNDQLFGGGGQDQLFAGEGDDLLSGGAGDDLLVAEGGTDTAFGGDGDDKMDGMGTPDESGFHVLSGGAGDDDIYVQGGNFLIGLGEGADILTLGAFGDEAGANTVTVIADFDGAEDQIVIEVEAQGTGLTGAETLPLDVRFTEVQTDDGPATLVEPATTDPELAAALSEVNGGIALLMGVLPEDIPDGSVSIVLSAA